MRRLALSLLALGAFAAAAIAQEEKLQPVTEANFAPLLLGCWEDGWHAQLADGTEGSGDSSLCFESGGILAFTYEHHTPQNEASSAGEGTYELKNNKLYLSNEDRAVEWPFVRHQIHCDAVVRPGQTLDLTSCTEDGTDFVDGAFSFGRRAE